MYSIVWCQVNMPGLMRNAVVVIVNNFINETTNPNDFLFKQAN